jgi:hypothetical protein
MANRSQFQIDTSDAVRNRVKAVAYSRGLTVTVFLLQALAKMDDKELTKIIEKDLTERTQRGRPKQS